MKTLYLDTFSGISGDMFLGAMLDLGVDFSTLQTALAKLSLHGYHLHQARAHRQQIEGVKFDVHLDHHHDHEHAHEHEPHGHGHDHHHDHGHEHAHPHPHTHTHEDEHAHAHEHGQEHSHEHSHDDEHHSHEHAHEHGRNFSQIEQLISESSLSAAVKEKAIAVFQRVATAEGRIHGMPPEQVHFHEVGAVDSIIDIVGACLALETLGWPRVLASSPIDGSGWIDCAHGRFPIPAPATLEILAARGVSVSQCDEPHELITPTGAALLAEFVEHFGLIEDLKVTRVGIGVGGRDNKTRPNVLRAILGESSAAPSTHDWETDTIAVLETNLDDIAPEILGHFIESAMAAGALDVFHTAIQMKKNRPGVLLTVLCPTSDADAFSAMILRETSSFGVRRSLAERRKLRREFQQVATPFGSVPVKIGRLDGRIVQAAPEYEACRKLAQGKDVPLKDIFDAARRALPAPPP